MVKSHWMGCTYLKRVCDKHYAVAMKIALGSSFNWCFAQHTHTYGRYLCRKLWCVNHACSFIALHFTDRYRFWIYVSILCSAAFWSDSKPVYFEETKQTYSEEVIIMLAAQMHSGTIRIYWKIRIKIDSEAGGKSVEDAFYIFSIRSPCNWQCIWVTPRSI